MIKWCISKSGTENGFIRRKEKGANRMNIVISKNPQELGKKAAKHTAELLNKAISEKGSARIVCLREHPSLTPSKNW
jgi:hypothetical protein